jgi:hypothetical protein
VSRPEPATAADARSLFRLGPHRPLATILAILAFLGLTGLAFGALLGEDVDVPAFVPDEGPPRLSAISLGSAPPAPGVRSVPAFQTETDEPSPIGEPGEQPGGEPTAFGPDGEGVVLVPDGWSVIVESDDHVTLGNGDGVRISLRILRVEAATPATQLVEETGAALLSPELAAHVRESTLVEMQPFGAIVTRAAVGYSALRIDAQGLTWVAGNALAYVRDDGVALVVVPEVTPATHWDARIEDWFAIWLQAVTDFAGGPPLA